MIVYCFFGFLLRGSTPGLLAGLLGVLGASMRERSVLESLRGSTPGLLAGLLGVLGASISGPVSESAPRGVAPRFARPLLRRASPASPKRRLHLRC